MHRHRAATPLVVAYAPRERTRAWVKRVIGKSSGRLSLARTFREFSGAFQKEVVDTALVDIATEGSEEAAGLALEYPSVGFVALTSFRPSDGPGVARCAELEFADVLVEGVDEGVARDVVGERGYSARFASALDRPPEALSLTSALQVTAWRLIIAGAGRPIRTSMLASAMGLTREHLSRSFGGDETPTLKRLIDLARLLSAAELAKNPGYDVVDVARVLGFSSSAHLSLTAQRLIGRRANSLAAMRGVDVIDRFVSEQSRLVRSSPRGRGRPVGRRPGGRR